MQKSAQIYGEMEIVSVQAAEATPKRMSVLKRLMVQHAYPPKAILDGLGLMWGLHFVWERLWIQAVVAVFGFALLGTFLVRRVSEESLARTVLGKFFLAFVHPGNLVAQLCGYSILVFGVWARSSFYSLVGISLVLLAHAAAWKRVFSQLNSETK